MGFDEVLREINKFRDDRDWRQFHTPKDLAISVSIEAAELLETFQWSGADTSVEARRNDMAEELADVLIYALMLADDLGFDPAALVHSKLEANAVKYPIERARGSSEKYTHFN